MDNKELLLLIEVQNSLENLWPLIDFYNTQTGLHGYAAPILEAFISVEKMVVLLAFEHGYEYNNQGRLVKSETNEPVGNGFVASIPNIIQECLPDMPNEIQEFLRTMQCMRNKTAHRNAVSYGEMIVYAEAFDCFVGWFVLNSSTLKNTNKQDFSKFMSRIRSFSKRMTIQIKSDHSELKEYQIASIIPQAEDAIINGNRAIETNHAILIKIDEKLKLLDQISSGVIQLNQKVDILANKLDVLVKQIGDYQSLVTKQIDMALSEDEIDRIISAYADECTNKIVREINGEFSNELYQSEKEELILSMESAWNKLDQMSQNFLISAKVTYKKLISMHDVVDYSGVCLLVTKAVEVEMSNRFYHDYLDFLKKKYPGNNNRMYPTPLINNGNIIQKKDFTLGSVAHILCYHSAYKLSTAKKENNLRQVMDFLSKKLMTGKNRKQINDAIVLIAEGVERIRNDYRNPSAHINQLQYINAKQCFDLVLDIEKLLKNILDTMDY